MGTGSLELGDWLSAANAEAPHNAKNRIAGLVINRIGYSPEET
jgi:hypothetical protein